MKPNGVLVVYKKTAYQIYVLEHKDPLFKKKENLRDVFYHERFKNSHERHYETLAEVRRVLRLHRIPFKAVYRTSRIDYAPFDLVISVGGDGTFLEAARHITRQAILGVNSNPSQSVGSFCAADCRTFETVFARALRGDAPKIKLNRLRLELNGRSLNVPVTNDILFCHRNPAAMSRYWIQVGRTREEHRSSGLWVSTAAGSTGAIRSAGGKALELGSKKIQYWPRELYSGRGVKYRLQGGCVSSQATLRFASLIREGVLYIDGPHFKIPVNYGDVLQVLPAAWPLTVIPPKRRRP